jgi:Rrf2 family protein
MIFSKSFGYALRGVLYIAFRQDTSKYVQVGEIASSISVPKHFMGKILKRLAKENIVTSTKGPSGGFTINDRTLATSLLQLAEVTGDIEVLHSCVLQFKECDGSKPCPLHKQMEGMRNKLGATLANTSIGDLLNNAEQDFVGSISALSFPIPKIKKEHFE